jgi:hypothetical protein
MIKFDEIESIECVGEEDFYDLEVPETHNYLAQDILHHNSGKDFICVRIIAYTAYFLMCLKSPQKYFKFADNEPIDLVNVSVSGDHAKKVFFTRLTQAVKNTINPESGKNWFEEKGMDLRDGKDVQTATIKFKNNITAHSLNSQKYTGEGKNILLAVFDEVGEFKPHKAKELYENLWFTAQSRWGRKENAPFRIVLISYLRDENDFMNFHWEETKQVENIFRSRKCTWEVRPDKTMEDFAPAFNKNPEEALRRFANELSGSLGNSFITYRDRIRNNVNKERKSPFIDNPIRTDDLNSLQLASWFKPFSVEELNTLIDKVEKNKEDEIKIRKLKEQHSDTQYYIHIDLAKGKEGGDCAGFALVHPYKLNPFLDESGTGVYLDLVMQLKGKDNKEIDFEKIRHFIYNLQDRGFPIAKVTLDGYQSVDMLQLLNKREINSEQLSVDKNDVAYQTLKELIYSGRLNYYEYIVLLRELEELKRISNGKIDHPDISRRRSLEENDDRGSKDCSDAVAGASLMALESSESEGDWVGFSV